MKFLLWAVCSLFLFNSVMFSQEKSVLIPRPVADSPFQFDDSGDMFGKAYRWFLEGDVAQGSQELRGIVSAAGYSLQPENHYVVVAHFTDTFSPIGVFNGNGDFLNTRFFGLTEDNLYFIFITREESPAAYVSALITAKASPSQENLLPFLSLFIPVIPPTGVANLNSASNLTSVDVRQFTIPEVYRKNSDISFLVKKQLSDETPLASAVFDNTSKERWSYGIATAITSIDDVDITVGGDGTIIVQPKSNLDLANFAAVNYYFSPVDTKQKSFGNSFHLMAGIRLIDFIEPIAGVGASFSLGILDLGLFAGYSVEVANELEEGFSIGDVIDRDVDPFKTTLRGKPRFGIQVKFP